MKKEIIALRKQMKRSGIWAYIIPTTDFHGSEYVNDYFKCREFLSGFTGSAGTLIVTMDEACLWTDGRYFLQASAELSGSGITLQKMGQPGVPTTTEYLKSVIPSGETLGFDGRVINAATGLEIKSIMKGKSVSIIETIDLADIIWKNRPTIQTSSIYKLPLSVTGLTFFEKMDMLMNELSKKNADYHLISNLEEIAWLLNMRADDISYTPVFFAFALINKEGLVTLYLLNQDCNDVFSDYMPKNSTIRLSIKNYLDIYEDLPLLQSPSSILLDESSVNYSLWEKIPEEVKIINDSSPINLLKAVKNKSEIDSTINAHIKDGIAMVNFIYWLKKSMGLISSNTKSSVLKETILTEISASNYLEECRRAQKGCKDLSFDTISGYNSNGAIVHYSATPESDTILEPHGFLLVDSGGQYTDGTTDITRTISLGPLTEKMRKYYTAVLRSNISLAKAQFPSGTTGADLDKIARKPLKAMNLDFNHGTGHGVGHLLAVHEGPNLISPRADKVEIIPGMITTDEPGLYIENEFGIRIENELLCCSKSSSNMQSDSIEEFSFISLTLCPFDRSSIIKEDLTSAELEYLNAYHLRVYKTLSPFLDEEISLWLKQETVEL